MTALGFKNYIFLQDVFLFDITIVHNSKEDKKSIKPFYNILEKFAVSFRKQNKFIPFSICFPLENKHEFYLENLAIVSFLL